MKAAGNAQQLPFERAWHIETRPAENRPPYLPPLNNMAARPRRDLPTKILNWNSYVSIVIKDFSDEFTVTMYCFGRALCIAVDGTSHKPHVSKIFDVYKIGCDRSWCGNSRVCAKEYLLFALTHLPLVLHICVSESGQHWFR